ncbi:MAG: ATP-binding protein [Deltaproteobacteria bacterium]|nr:ATP-binding protein [Deltaproteobacteria bacterium]
MSRDLGILTRTAYAPSEIAPLDLEAMVYQAARDAEGVSVTESPEAGVTIKPYLRAMPALYGHGPDIQLALTHILRNAVEASPERSVVYLTTETSAGMGLIYIQDSGYGILESVSGRIFDPFFTTRPKTHRGLGLSLARSIIEGHGGNITVSTHEGGGTMVTVQLPIQNRRRSRPQARKKKKISDAHILFTGEEGTVARLICRMLEDKGAVVSMASSLKEGIDVLNHRDVDLMIADGKTPGIKRIRFIDRVKRQKPDLPVLLLNPDASSGAGGGAGEMVPDRVMGKPLLIDRVVRVSATLLSGEGA